MSELIRLAAIDALGRLRRIGVVPTALIVMLGTYFYFPPIEASYAMFTVNGVRGVYDSHWMGSISALGAALLIFSAGFFLVREAAGHPSRVAHLIAASSVSTLKYIASKAMANVAILGVFALALLAAAIATQALRAEAPDIRASAYAIPWIGVVLPAVLMVSCGAVLFSAVASLRGVWGVLLYLFMLSLMTLGGLQPDLTAGSSDNAEWLSDPMGIAPIVRDVLSGVHASLPVEHAVPRMGYALVEPPAPTFAFVGSDWNSAILFSRLLWVTASVMLLALASRLYPRSDLSMAEPTSASCKLARDSFDRTVPQAERLSASADGGRARTRSRATFWRLCLGELRVLYASHRRRWPWMLSVFPLVLSAGIALPADIGRSILLPAIWLFPIGVWSQIGCRDALNQTEELLAGCPTTRAQRLAAQWALGLCIAVLGAGGVALRLIIEGEWMPLLVLTLGSIFIPSVAVLAGTLSHGPTLFQVSYLLLWYTGPVNGVQFLNFTSGTDSAIPMLVLATPTILLTTLCMVWWQRR